MPLYTYVITYRGRTHLAQARRSNFKGFADWATVIPDLGSTLQRELGEAAYRAEFAAVPNRKNVWKASLALGGDDLTVHAIQTDG